MYFDGNLLERGFWLYVWKIETDGQLYLYVGRTGDNSSSNAGSPFTRATAHLDHSKNAKANALFKRLGEIGIAPKDCKFRMSAFGPIFPEQDSMIAHTPVRNKVAALATELSRELRARNYCV